VSGNRREQQHRKRPRGLRLVFAGAGGCDHNIGPDAFAFGAFELRHRDREGLGAEFDVDLRWALRLWYQSGFVGAPPLDSWQLLQSGGIRRCRYFSRSAGSSARAVDDADTTTSRRWARNLRPGRGSAGVNTGSATGRRASEKRGVRVKW
jgi:hypothetical protein